MRLKCRSVLMAVLLTVLNSGYAAPTSASVAREAAATTMPVASGADKTPVSGYLFARPLTFRGTLGDATIEMHLQLKPDPTEGLQGTYFTTGQSAKVLLAGEYEDGDVLMEESVN